MKVANKKTAKMIAERMRIITGSKTYAELGKFFEGIKSQSISSSIDRSSIPDKWFFLIEEHYGVTREELLQPATRVTATLEQPVSVIPDQICNITAINNGTHDINEPGLDTVRHYKETAGISHDILNEINTWLQSMESYRPGFTAWFRLEFQNRFPEFDEWKAGQRKQNPPV